MGKDNFFISIGCKFSNDSMGPTSFGLCNAVDTFHRDLSHVEFGLK